MALYRSHCAAGEQSPDVHPVADHVRPGSRRNSGLPVPVVLPRRIPGSALAAAQQGRFGWFATAPDTGSGVDT